MKRRDLLKRGLLAGATTALAGCLPRGIASGPPTGALFGGDAARPWAGRIRNVIFLAYDGTGYEDAATAGHFSRRVLNRPLLFEQLLSEGYCGSMYTNSLTSVVTDSAAASSAWATGRKVANPYLSMYPDGTPLTTIFQLAQGQGLRTGLVTSTRVTHATPAAWATRVSHRDIEDEVARQYLEVKPDVLLGGGRGPFEAEHRGDGRDLFEEFREAGYDIVQTAEELDRSNGSRLLGAFTPGLQYLPYEVDRRFQEHPAPSLTQLTRKALDVLSGADQGFVLQVEAGRIDHANHHNDPGALVWDWAAADDTLQVIKSHVDGRDDTLLIIACDHDTGGGVVYGFGPWYVQSTPAFETLGACRSSHEWLVREVLSRSPSAGEVRDSVQQYLGIPLNHEQAVQIAELLSTRPLTPDLLRGHPNAHRTQPNNSLAYLLSISPDWEPNRPNIAFATGQHTAGLVPAILYGPMIPRGNMGVIDNTELFRVMIDALGIEFENPVMTEEEALRAAATALLDVESSDPMHA